jgi:glycosyltransferase involved in cell wall biosynthesis
MREEACVNLSIAVKKHSMHEIWFALSLYLASYIEKQLVNDADLLISNSNYTCTLLKRVYGCDKSCKTIYPGVSDRFYPMNLEKERIRLLYTGRLDQRKGILILLKAFRIIVQKHNDVELLIGGDGPERQRLESYVINNGMTNNVRFLGRAPYEKVPEVFNRSSIFVFPTLYEPFGLVAAEALATELPVIASRIGAIPEIVDESCGILVPPNDPEALASAIEVLIDDEPLRRSMGKNGRKKVKEKFSWERMAKEVILSYEGIL